MHRLIENDAQNILIMKKNVIFFKIIYKFYDQSLCFNIEKKTILKHTFK